MPSGVQERLGPVEAPDPIMDLVTFYAQNLAVPARRDIDKPDVLKGKQLFYESGCASCHTPKFVTRRDAPNKAQSFQLIWPYSDFLLHDLGDGLADGQQVGDASGSEWRTRAAVGHRADQDGSTATLSSCMTGARAISPRRSCGMAARPRKRATPLPRSARRIATRW